VGGWWENLFPPCTIVEGKVTSVLYTLDLASSGWVVGKEKVPQGLDDWGGIPDQELQTQCHILAG
jgi:hypothetical protein